MTENENSPENLRKFLESDDPALVRMGIAMAKGTELDITVKDLETLLQHENIEIVKIGFAFAVENKRENEAIEAILDDDWSSNAEKMGKIGEAAIKPIHKVLEEKGAEHDALITSLVEIGNVEAICFALEKCPIGTSWGDLDWDACSHYMEVLAETGHPRALELLLNGTLSYPFSYKDSSHYHQASCVATWCYEASDIVNSTEYLYAVNFVLNDGLGMLWEEGVITMTDPWPFPVSDKVTTTIIKVLEEGGGDWPDVIITILGEIGDKRAVEPITKFLNENQDWEEVQDAGKEALEKLE